jgi:hypothetical protein
MAGIVAIAEHPHDEEATRPPTVTRTVGSPASDDSNDDGLTKVLFLHFPEKDERWSQLYRQDTWLCTGIGIGVSGVQLPWKHTTDGYDRVTRSWGLCVLEFRHSFFQRGHRAFMVLWGRLVLVFFPNLGSYLSIQGCLQYVQSDLIIRPWSHAVCA